LFREPGRHLIRKEAGARKLFRSKEAIQEPGRHLIRKEASARKLFRSQEGA